MAAEKRLVDANTVYEMGHRTPFHIGIADLCDLKELLEDVPTVDAVEVVRCKDCAKAILPEGMLVECTEWHEPVSVNGYCHRGARRTDAKMDGGAV